MEDRFDVNLVALAFDDLAKAHRGFVRAFLTGAALAAGFDPQEFREAVGHLNHAIRVVIDHEAAGAEAGAGNTHLVEIERRVELFGENAGSGDAGEDSFELAAGKKAAAPFFNEFAERDPERELVDSGTLDVAGNCENHVAGRGARTHGAEPIGALSHDVRHVAHGFAIVDERRIVLAGNT